MDPERPLGDPYPRWREEADKAIERSRARRALDRRKQRHPFRWGVVVVIVLAALVTILILASR